MTNGDDFRYPGRVRFRRAATMASLILAGESVYLFPYALRREFTPAIVETFGITKLQLGTMSAVFGVFALLCYFPGGWLADRFSARVLLTFSLMGTAAAGLLLLLNPSFAALAAIYGAWGVTSILTFWGALIKATRGWGGDDAQGTAFGLLDGGRGLVAAAIASASAWLFAASGQGAEGLRAVIVLYAMAAGLAGLATWALLPSEADQAPLGEASGLLGRVAEVIRIPAVWRQTLIVFCGYSAYWGTFDIAVYAVEGYGMEQAQGAWISASALWVRPVAAFGAGWLADRTRLGPVMAGAFTIMVLAFMSFSALPPGPFWLLVVNTIGISLGASALRGVYYAMMEEADVPWQLTGTTVGVVSVLGYSPDIIIPPLQGFLLDSLPGAEGHRLYFGLLAGVSAVGAAASFTQGALRR